jgi:hypothetical protein
MVFPFRPSNPFPARFIIAFALEREEAIDLDIDDLDGSRVRTLFRYKFLTGEHQMS